MIIKKNIQASKNNDAVETIEEKKEPVYGNEFEGKYAEAQDHIMEAIKALTEIAQDDEVAKDSLANLSVVLLDLQGNK